MNTNVVGQLVEQIIVIKALDDYIGGPFASTRVDQTLHGRSKRARQYSQAKKFWNTFDGEASSKYSALGNHVRKTELDESVRVDIEYLIARSRKAIQGFPSLAPNYTNRDIETKFDKHEDAFRRLTELLTGDVIVATYTPKKKYDNKHRLVGARYDVEISFRRHLSGFITGLVQEMVKKGYHYELSFKITSKGKHSVYTPWINEDDIPISDITDRFRYGKCGGVDVIFKKGDEYINVSFKREGNCTRLDVDLYHDQESVVNAVRLRPLLEILCTLYGNKPT